MKKKARKYIIIRMSIIVLGILSFSVYQSYAYFKVNYTGDIINTTIGVFSTTPYLANDPLSSPIVTSIFWGGPIGRDVVEEVAFTTTNEVPAGVIGSWDAGLKKNGKVMAWYTDTNANGKYEVVVGANGGVYAPENSSHLFRDFVDLNSLNLTSLNVSKVINMGSMFSYAGFNSTVFTLDLGDDFDTSNVTTMNSMFSWTGYRSTVFTLDLGDKFNTSNVTNMYGMFSSTGYSSTVFTLDLGDKFDTSNATQMSSMFSSTGRNSTTFTLDLGDKFDTNKVIEMMDMFSSAGYSSSSFTLDLGEKFDTSNVNNMWQMFSYTGYNSTVFTLDLKDKFDTSKVKYMNGMFSSAGYSNSAFVLDLRNFNVDAVTMTDAVTLGTQNASHKLYASSSNISFMSGKGFTGTIINCTISPASCP